MSARALCWGQGVHVQRLQHQRSLCRTGNERADVDPLVRWAGEACVRGACSTADAMGGAGALCGRFGAGLMCHCRVLLGAANKGRVGRRAEELGAQVTFCSVPEVRV